MRIGGIGDRSLRASVSLPGPCGIAARIVVAYFGTQRASGGERDGPISTLVGCGNGENCCR